MEFKRFGGTKHCVRGTSEAELVDELKVFENCDNTISVEKNSTSYMESPRFRELIGKLVNLNEIDIVGCCTDICIANGVISMMNYFDQVNRRVEVRVHEDAIETFGKCREILLEECENKNFFYQLFLSVMQLFSPLL